MTTTRQTISIRVERGLKSIDAWRDWEFACHKRALDHGFSADEWSITHVPSGICFPATLPDRDRAEAAMREIAALRSDWAAFDVTASLTAELKASILAIFVRHGGAHRTRRPGPRGDRPGRLGQMRYAPDLNGYRGRS